MSDMVPAKGWRDLFAAACTVCDGDEDVRFDFYGNASGGEGEEGLVQVFTGGAHADRICWHGAVYGSKKAEALMSGDLFCFPSGTEQLPLAVLDAMSAGLPVITTLVGAATDAIDGPEHGWVVPIGDEAALAEAIREALSDPSRLRSIGRANRLCFEERFSVGPFAARWKDLLLDLLAQTPRKSS